MKPVLFIPGFPASELHDSRSGMTLFPPSLSTLLDPVRKRRFLRTVIDVPGPLIAGPPMATVGGIVREAQSLYDILAHQFGYDTSGLDPHQFAPIGWDWREGIGAAGVVSSLRAVLDLVSPARDGNVVAIVHSTGGLVLRAFLEQQPAYGDCFEQLLAFGVPWCGTLEALHAMTAGDSETLLFIKLITAGEGARMVSHAQAAYDLLPTDPGTNLFIARGRPSTPLADESWIGRKYMRALAATAHGPFPRRFDALRVTNVCGWGAPTWPSCTLVGRKLTFLPREKDAGDGTVPLVSSSWLQGARVRTLFLPIGAYATGFTPRVHGQLWDSPPVLQIFDEVIGDAARTPFIAAAADGDEFLDFDRDVTVRIAAMAADGSPLPDCTATANLGGNPAIFRFNGETRGSIVVRRTGIRHNIEPDLYRFTIDFRWDGGSAERAVVIRAA